MGHLTYTGREGARDAASSLQRVDGAALLAVAASDDGGGRVRDLYQRAPCRLLFPDDEPGGPLHAVLLTTSGGLTGGDRIAMTLEVDARARAVLTTQAAEKLYRTLPEEAATCIEVRVKAGPGAWTEWLAQETILFDGARLRRRFSADLAADARMLALESVVFGRTAMGESFNSGFLHDAWRVRCGGRLLWADALRLEGDLAQARHRPWGIGASVACATLLYAGADAAALLEPVRNTLIGVAGAGATLLPGLLITRLWSEDAAALRAQVTRLAALVRHEAGGCPPRLPRVWHC